MWEPEVKPLPEWIQQAYDLLTTRIERRRGVFTRKEAYDVLEDSDAFAEASADAQYAVRYLLDRGWLYEVGEDLRVTDPER